MNLAGERYVYVAAVSEETTRPPEASFDSKGARIQRVDPDGMHRGHPCCVALPGWGVGSTAHLSVHIRAVKESSGSCGLPSSNDLQRVRHDAGLYRSRQSQVRSQRRFPVDAGRFSR